MQLNGCFYTFFPGENVSKEYIVAYHIETDPRERERTRLLSPSSHQRLSQKILCKISIFGPSVSLKHM